MSLFKWVAVAVVVALVSPGQVQAQDKTDALLAAAATNTSFGKALEAKTPPGKARVSCELAWVILDLDIAATDFSNATEEQLFAYQVAMAWAWDSWNAGENTYQSGNGYMIYGDSYLWLAEFDYNEGWWALAIGNYGLAKEEYDSAASVYPGATAWFEDSTAATVVARTILSQIRLNPPPGPGGAGDMELPICP